MAPQPHGQLVKAIFASFVKDEFRGTPPAQTTSAPPTLWSRPFFLACLLLSSSWGGFFFLWCGATQLSVNIHTYTHTHTHRGARVDSHTLTSTQAHEQCTDRRSGRLASDWPAPSDRRVDYRRPSRLAESTRKATTAQATARLAWIIFFCQKTHVDREITRPYSRNSTKLVSGNYICNPSRETH